MSADFCIMAPKKKVVIEEDDEELALLDEFNEVCKQ